MGLIDILGWIAPGRTARYLFQRSQFEAARLYDSARPSQYRRPISNQTSGDGVMQLAGTKIREIARHLDENHDLTIAVLDDLVNGALGTGVIITPMLRKDNGELDSELNEKILEAWKLWCKVPEVTKEMTFAQCERQMARAVFRDGEMFVQHMEKPIGFDYPTATRYAIELLEADMVPMEFRDSPRRILQGVECNDWNAPIAYWLWKNHPGDPNRTTLPLESELKRIPRELILHPKFTRRIRQRRGVSVLHGVLNRMQDLKDYEESERIAAKVAADFTWFIKKTQEYNPGGAVQAEAGARNLKMQGGMGFELLPGEEVGTLSSDRPNTNLVDYREGMLRAVAGGTGSRFSSISRNYNGTYSSQRQELVEGSVSYNILFEYFVSVFHRPVYERWIVNAARAGVLGKIGLQNSSKVENLVRAEYRPPSLPWIDPQKEASANETLVNTGLESRSEIMRKRGRDPTKVWEEIKEEQDSGLFPPLKATAAAPATPVQSSKPDSSQGETADAAAA